MGFNLATAALVPVVLELDIRAGAVASVMIHASNEDQEAAARAILESLGLPIARRPSRPARPHGLRVLSGGRDPKKGGPAPGCGR